LTGRAPFVEDTMVKLVLAHLEKEPRPLHEVRPDVSAELSAVVGRMLAKDPAQRYQKPIEVAQTLLPFIKVGTKPDVAVPPGVASAGTGTRIGGDTSRIKELGAAASKLPAKGAPAGDEEEKGSPFQGLSGAPSVAPRKVKPAQAAWWKRPPVLAGAGAAVLVLAAGAWLLAGVVFKTKVKTADGEALVVLEIDQPGAEVLVDGETITVNVPGDNKPVEITVPPGKHTLQVKKGEFVAFTREIELAAGRSPPIKVRLAPVAPAPPKDSVDRWFAVGTRWEGKTVSPTWGTGPWWFTVRSREGNKFKGRLVGAGRGDWNIEGTLGDDGTSLRWTYVSQTPNVWQPDPNFRSGTSEGKCSAERIHMDWKLTYLDGAVAEGYCDFTVRRNGPRNDDEEVWPPPLNPRRAAVAPAGMWSVQGGELMQEEFVADAKNPPMIRFGDIGWKDYDFHLQAMKTAGDEGFRINFDGLRPGKISQWCIGIAGNRVTKVELVEALPTGVKFTPLSEHKAMAIADNQWYDILIKARGQWVECFLDGQSVVRFAHPDRWGGQFGFGCMRMAGRFRDIGVKAPDGKVLWEGPPELP
jgi:hypothetical protein